jgi:hypothetical protein
MPAKKLCITDPTGTIKGLNVNVRYEKMDREDAPKIEHRVGDVVVNFRSVHDGVVLLEGMTQKVWCDEKGQQYDKDQIKHYFEGQEVTTKAQTTIFEIIGFQPLSSYTDSYIIEKYYELFPDEDGHTKDFDKECARRKNLVGMRALWEYLHEKQLVARGSFNASSSGFLESDCYIRAISFGNKWILELAKFSQEKIFSHLQEGLPEPIVEKKSPSRLKRV